MSWQQYIDTSLVGTGHIDKAAIVSSAGDSVWAHSSDFNIKSDELKNLSVLLSGDKAAKEKAFADGIHIGGERYVATMVEEGSIYARQGQAGIWVAKTKQAFIVAHHHKDQVAGNASVTVGALSDYLAKLGY